MIYAMLVACEVGFWVVLLSGLLSRYVLRRRTLGAVLLACVPLVDLALLAFAVVDMQRGARATIGHGLAAMYLGFTVAFGPKLVQWADVRVAHRFADGPAPARPARFGPEHARRIRGNGLRHVLAFAIGMSLLATAILVVDDPDRTGNLGQVAVGWSFLLLVDLVILARYTLWPRPEPAGAE